MQFGMGQDAAEELAARIRSDTGHRVQVHAEGSGYSVRVITGRGTFYLRSVADWERTSLYLKRPMDAPTETRDPVLARQTRHAMERGATRAASELQGQGVRRAIPYLSYYLAPVVWLEVTRDDDRARLSADGEVRESVIRHLRGAGVRDDLLAEVNVWIESQETVDRDFGGDWYAAMK
jgi:hypothetical protein